MSDAALNESIAGYFREQAPGVACVYLFGSRARGEARADSDVDLGVLYRAAPPSTLDGLGLTEQADLQELLELPVDIVVMNRASPDLAHRVLRDGILVFEADRAARVRFEVRSRADYFDLLPYIREYRRAGGSRHGR